MYPVLGRVSLFGIERPIGSYGVLVVLAWAVGVVVAVARARRYRLERFDVLAVGLLALPAGLTGALAFGAIVTDGTALVFYGGFAGGVLAAAAYARAYRLPFWALADCAAPALALAHAVGRVGCWLGGCCWGRVVDGERVPVQLWEAGGLTAIALALLCVARTRACTRPRFSGRLFCMYAALYALSRLCTERLRGDELARGRLFGLHPSEWVALWTLAIAPLVWRALPKEPHGRRDPVQLR